MDNTLAARVKECLRLSGMSGADVARELGISRSAISQWLKGNVKNIRGDNLILLASKAGVRPEWLVSGKAPKFSTGPEGDQSPTLDTQDKMYSYYVTHPEHELLQTFRSLTPQQQETLVEHAQFLLQRAPAVITPIPVKKSK